MKREFIIMIGARPHARALTFGECRDWIAALPHDDLSEISIWRVYPSTSLEPSTDATEELARWWAEQVEATTRPGLRVSYPEFVVTHLVELAA